jgi:hypothetical protein
MTFDPNSYFLESECFLKLMYSTSFDGRTHTIGVRLPRNFLSSGSVNGTQNLPALGVPLKAACGVNKSCKGI